MDLEAIQILNLSPIPELSEIELSTMLEHLSGLSDINGDLTDRNVEDILKEAEDLLDKSTSSQIHESRSLSKSLESEGNNLGEINQHVNIVKDKEQNSEPLDVEKSKQQVTSISSNSQMNTLNEQDANDHCTSSAENLSMIYSPGSSSNPIKSTIDSLKEFSTYIEKKLANQSSNSSPKHIDETKKNQNNLCNKEVSLPNSCLSKKSCDTKQTPISPKMKENPNLNTKNSVIKPLEKSVKLLNCFERLYKDRPVRLNTKKPKVVDKVPKTIIKKKFSKDLKGNKKSNWQGKTLAKKITEEEVDSKIFPSASQAFLRTSSYNEELSKPKQMTSKYYLLNEHKYLLQNKGEEKLLQQDCLSEGAKFDQPRMDEKLMLKVLEGMEEIKNQVKRVSAVSSGENSSKTTIENEEDIEILKPKVNSEKNAYELEFNRNSGIKRLEEQFCNLKEKYNHQIDKLEAENLKLKEALNRQQEMFSSQKFIKIDDGQTIINSLRSFSPEKKISQTFSLENCKAPENSPCSSTENVQISTAVKEAFSQTEQNVKNTSIQCSQESREVGTNSNTEIISETKKVENKENLNAKKKPGKNKPFSDVNVHYTIRQKKALEHETQLLATLRGLQAEVNMKDKENKKLKSEIESLKRQMKKVGNVKIDNCRRCSTGTQTIGLGIFMQKPYNPADYEVPTEFEKENEDLKSRIKALEEDFEFLKEKRISDLQSLHQVHEEEMAKLVSKLETQSALTKHLHSLLVNR